MSAPLVSVVIPLFQKAETIVRCLNSVLAQTVKDFEVVVVDDGSTDGGGDLVEKICDPRIRLIRQDNAGVSAARNRGISEARAALISFLDADDEYKPQFLETVLRLKTDFPEAGAMGTSYEYYDDEGDSFSSKNPDIPAAFGRGILHRPVFLLANNMFYHSSAVMVKRKAIEEVGGFPPGIKLNEDIDTWLRLAITFPLAWDQSVQAVVHLDAPNRASRLVDTSLASALTARRVLESQKLNAELRADLEEFLVKNELIIITNLLIDGQPARARKHLKRLPRSSKYRSWQIRAALISLMPPGVYRWYRRIRGVTESEYSLLPLK